MELASIKFLQKWTPEVIKFLNIFAFMGLVSSRMISFFHGFRSPANNNARSWINNKLTSATDDVVKRLWNRDFENDNYLNEALFKYFPINHGKR